MVLLAEFGFGSVEISVVDVGTPLITTEGAPPLRVVAVKVESPL
jgi:3-keto-L-gulonate-6-phosphate decarboxylase